MDAKRARNLEDRMGQSKIGLRLGPLVFAGLALFPWPASAQTIGIAGVVTDATGAVLPGATVEAASPALIEKVRSVVTNEQGLYSILDLRPGVYTVTFTLSGFTTVKREGIELTGSFTATVNAEMRVGSVEETITVSGEAPAVDIRNIVQQKVLTSEVMLALPSARNVTSLGALLPGVMSQTSNRPAGQDVGGLAGERGRVTIHGGRSSDFSSELDGQAWQLNVAQGQFSSITLNPGEAQEFVYELGALSVGNEAGGIRVNVIPKEGGNRFQGLLLGTYTSGSLQSNNLDNNLRNRGLTTVNRNDKIWDVNPSYGGPILRDKLWFYGSFRHWGEYYKVAGMFHPVDPRAFVYVPDTSRPAIDENWIASAGLRLTWQAHDKHKFSIYGVHQPRCQCVQNISATRAPQATNRQVAKMNRLIQVSWKSPLTPRLLIEAYAMDNRNRPYLNPHPGTEEVIPAVEQRTGLLFRANPNYDAYLDWYSPHYKAAISYVTGSHAVKFGTDYAGGHTAQEVWVNGDTQYVLLDGIPRSITVFNTPRFKKNDVNGLGIFAQDQWTFRRLTLNAGVRFDRFVGSVPAQRMGAGRWVPARDFAAVSDVPNWKDVSPRLGVAYDLFGNSKTALKVTASRYVERDRTTFSGANNPVDANGASATRTWNDRDGDFIPQEDELGLLSNRAFGTTAARTTKYDDAIREGWFVRPYNWEVSASIQHELRPQVSLNVGYFRRWFGNFTTTDNLLVTPADFDEYCITAPADARLPGGGTRICGLYDIQLTKFGLVDNLVTFAKNYGTQQDVYNGVDITANVRLPRRVLLSGGVNTGTTMHEGNNVFNSIESCFVVDSPGALRFCDINVPWRTQVKLLGTVGLPWDVDLAATFQSVPGPEIQANLTVTSAQTTLGRNLSTGTVTVPLVPRATMFGDHVYQIDIRLTKSVPVGRTRIKGTLDLYNALNANPVLVENLNYGASWRRPIYVLPGRMVKLGAQVDF